MGYSEMAEKVGCKGSGGDERFEDGVMRDGGMTGRG